jgi:dienelactone hydrolase
MRSFTFFLMVACGVTSGVESWEIIPETRPLTAGGDLAVKMVEGIDAYLMRAIVNSVDSRAIHWNRDFSSHEAYTRSVEPNRNRLATIIGATDSRNPVQLVLREPGETASNLMAEQSGPTSVRCVEWSVFRTVTGEGLLVDPFGEWRADVVLLPDCDVAPESFLSIAEFPDESANPVLLLARSGCRVLIPQLANRLDTWSGDPRARMTNQPHREFVYRGAYEMGRHIIGYEVQRALAAIDWLEKNPPPAERGSRPIGVIGFGEGGLLAFYIGALDPRVKATVVSGYFGPREGLWKEPIYRNVWGLLSEFGDAEIASLIAPRALIIEVSDHPSVLGPPEPRDGRSGAAPGIIQTPKLDDVRREFDRARSLVSQLTPAPAFHLIDAGGKAFGTPEALARFLEALRPGTILKKTASGATDTFHSPSDWRDRVTARAKRQFEQLVEDTQHLMRESPYVRAKFWEKADASSVEKWVETTQWHRHYFAREVIGELPPPDAPINPRTRLVYDEPGFRGYEVMLDVYDDVFAYGILLLPKDVRDGERRPVVVCQHGLEGRPQDVADPKNENPYYHRYACRLAERGFIVYAPQNPYIGGDQFRVLQRKANPLKLSLFSFVTKQHARTLEWLKSLPFVDPDRIAFYGLSYGGKTAMRAPAQLEDYCLSICSADYNEWIWKNVSARSPYSYMFTGEYEMFEFNLGNTFNYAEMSWLIFPRPFMVERGHHDGVAPDEWVAYEYAKTRRRYALSGLADRTEIEYFDGPHSIHGVGTFEFLHKHLDWPKP